MASSKFQPPRRPSGAGFNQPPLVINPNPPQKTVAAALASAKRQVDKAKQKSK